VLHYMTRPPRGEPRWPLSCGLKSFLNSSINKKLFFLSQVVKNNKAPQLWGIDCGAVLRVFLRVKKSPIVCVGYILPIWSEMSSCKMHTIMAAQSFPGGRRLAVLKASINSTPSFVSEIVVSSKGMEP